MPRLILLNGPPGIGKSTIARRFVDVGGISALEDTYDRLADLVDARPRAITITATEDDVDGTLAAVVATLV